MKKLFLSLAKQILKYVTNLAIHPLKGMSYEVYSLQFPNGLSQERS